MDVEMITRALGGESNSQQKKTLDYLLKYKTQTHLAN